jgi:hypothetical protein
MLDHITSPYQIEQEALQIDSFLNITCSDNPTEAVERGNDLVVYLARTGKLLADSKFHQEKALSESIVKEFGRQAGLAPSILNKLVEASCKHENYLVNWVERLHRTCTHQLDWLRTIVSKNKTEMQYQNFTK